MAAASMELGLFGSNQGERRPLRAVGSREQLVPKEPCAAAEVVPPPEKLMIGLFGSFALVVNNISGPGMLDFPRAFQTGGWLPCVICIFVVASVSAAVACYLSDAHGRLRESEGGRALEFSNIFGVLYGPKVFGATQSLYFLNLFSQNVAAIVSTAQATDSMFATLLKRSYALKVPYDIMTMPSVLSWTGCVVDGCTPFDAGSQEGASMPLQLGVFKSDRHESDEPYGRRRKNSRGEMT